MSYKFLKWEATLFCVLWNKKCGPKLRDSWREISIVEGRSITEPSKLTSPLHTLSDLQSSLLYPPPSRGSKPLTYDQLTLLSVANTDLVIPFLLFREFISLSSPQLLTLLYSLDVSSSHKKAFYYHQINLGKRTLIFNTPLLHVMTNSIARFLVKHSPDHIFHYFPKLNWQSSQHAYSHLCILLSILSGQGRGRFVEIFLTPPQPLVISFSRIPSLLLPA